MSTDIGYEKNRRLKRLAAAGGAAALVATSIAAGIGLAPSAIAEENPYARSAVFSYTGSMQSWTVPAGVTEVTARVWGAGGGGIHDDGSVSLDAAGGGGGAYLEAKVPVEPGDELSLVVGQGGVTGEAVFDSAVYEGKSYGFGNGAMGGPLDATPRENMQPGEWGQNGSQGGGLSAVLTSPSIEQQNALVVAGGGGGAGTWVPEGAAGRSAAGGGGVATGANATSAPFAGKGGTSAQGGAAGYAPCAYPAQPGTPMRGGTGGEAETGLPTELVTAYGGGGGGAGWYGGGGGSCIDAIQMPAIPSVPYPGAGGGGSSHVVDDGQLVNSMDGGNGIAGSRSTWTEPAGGISYAVPTEYSAQVTYEPGVGGGLATGPDSYGHHGLIILEWEQVPSADDSEFNVSTGNKPVGENHTVTVQMNDAEGNPIDLTDTDLAKLMLVLPNDPDGVLSTSSFQKGVGVGVYTATVTSTKPGGYPLEVTYDGDEVPVLDNDTAAFVVGEPNFDCAISEHCSYLTATEDPILADGTAEGTVTATVVDKYGNVISGQNVTFTFPSELSLASGTATVSTGTNGQASVKFTSGDVGLHEVTAAVGTSGITKGSPAELEFVAGDGEQTYDVDTNIAVADGSETVTITVISRDEQGHPVAIDAGDLDASLGDPDVDGDRFTFSDFEDKGNGVYEATVSSTLAGVFPISVAYKGTGVVVANNTDATFKAGPVDFSNPNTRIEGQTGTAVADGTEIRTVTAYLFDQYDNPVGDTQVSFESDDLGTQVASTDDTGMATVSYSSTTADSYLVAGSVAGQYIRHGDVVEANTGYGQIQFRAGAPDPSTSTYIVSENADIYANGADEQTVTVTLRDAHGNLALLGDATLVGDADAADVAAFTGSGSEYVAAITSTVPGTFPVTVQLNGVPVSPEDQANTDAAFVPEVSVPPVVDEVTTDGASGTGVPGAEIEITDPGSGETVCTATVGPDGSWSCTFVEPQDPETELTGTQTEPGKSPSGPVDVVVPPVVVPEVSVPPVVDEVTTDGASGTGVPGAEIEITDPGSGETVCTATVGPDGSWSCTFVEPQDPETELTGTQTEPGKSPSGPVDVVVPPVVVPEVSVPPVVDEVTTDGASGTGVPGAEIEITDPGSGETVCTATVGPDGSWSCTFVEPQDPETELTGTQTEPGKSPSGPVDVVVPPVVVPEVSVPPVVDEVTTDGASGTGVPGAEIEITDPGSGETVCTATVGPDGSWSCTFVEPQDPETELTGTQTEPGKSPSGPVDVVVPPVVVPEVSVPPVVDEVTTDGASGTGVPGAEIEITDPGSGETVCTATVGPDGSWSCTFVEPQDPETELTGTQTEPGKSPSGPVDVVVPPVVVPEVSVPPVVDEVTTDGASGTGVPGAEIEITDPGSGETVCTATVGPDGSWSCTFVEPQDPETELTGTQTEPGKSPSGPVDVVVPPVVVPEVSVPPVVDEVTTDGASGTGVPGAEIEITDPGSGETVCTATVGPDGSWSCTFVEPQDPETELTGTQTEPGKSPSGPVDVVVPPVVVPEVSVPPVVDEVTTDGASGTGVPGAEIEITDPGSGETVCTATVGPDGSWSCTFVEPQDPETELTGTQTEPGKSPSGPVDVVVPPVVVPEVSVPPVVDEVTTDGASGTGVPGAEIEITDPGSGETVCTATVGPDGSWSCTFVEPQDPETELTGTQTEPGKSPSGPVDVVVPPVVVPEVSVPPVVDEVTTDGASGTGVPGAEIEITDPGSGETVCTATVGPDGSWSCTFVEPQDPETELTGTQTEPGKSPSGPVDVVVPPVVVPEVSVPPVVDEVTTDGASGTGVPGAEIEITDPGSGETVCTATVGPDGSWSCTFVEPQDPETELTGTQTEPGKSPSGPVDVVVPPVVVPEVSVPPVVDEVTTDGASGTGVPGAEIEITDPGSGETVCTATVGPDGSWSCTFVEPQDPGTSLEVTQTENGKDPSTPVVVEIPEAEGPGTEKPGAEKPGTEKPSGGNYGEQLPETGSNAIAIGGLAAGLLIVGLLALSVSKRKRIQAED
ncbi:Ig-like domain-containing protein [Actinomycetaceae bacterium MB13-C1-2]|nr:Ig-like domain-containing protein [Actinomycetaceae bacterium MB13-C1-2]